MTYFHSRQHRWQGVSAGLLVIVLAGPLAESAAAADVDSLVRITFSVADDNTRYGRSLNRRIEIDLASTQ